MRNLGTYSSIELLRDGHRVEIRALKPADRPALEAAVDKTSPLSLYRRFFAVRTAFTEEQTNFFVNVDFKTHVALIAVAENAGAPVIAGGGRYVLVADRKAEIAFMIVDAYQGKGVGTLLLRHLTAIAREAGLSQFVAEVLSENAPMLKLFEKCGLPMSVQREADIVHVTLDL